MASLTLYARRDYSVHDGRKITFVSKDRADDQPRGWISGWFEDGVEFPASEAFAGYTLTHVYEASWRCEQPKQIDAETVSRALRSAA